MKTIAIFVQHPVCSAQSVNGIVKSLQSKYRFKIFTKHEVEDNFFDIAFIDGNHESDVVYRDGIMVLQKMKSGGTIIFDDYDWRETKIGIDKFINENLSKLKNVRSNTFQMFVDKL